MGWLCLAFSMFCCGTGLMLVFFWLFRRPPGGNGPTNDGPPVFPGTFAS